MYISHIKSTGRALDDFSRKSIHLFLFNTARPVDNSDFAFDPTDPLACYANCVAVAKGNFVIENNRNLICKQTPDREGVRFKGSGLDQSTGNHWLVPSALTTNRTNDPQERFSLINMLALDEARWSDNTPVAFGDWFEYQYDHDVDVDGIDFDFVSTDNIGSFEVQIWDSAANEGAGEWTVVATYDGNTYTDRDQFVQQYTTRRIRVLFTASGSSNFASDHLMFWSTNTSPAENFDTTVPAGWALAVFDLKNHPAQAVLPNEFPYMWMELGSPLAPNSATVDSVEIKPGRPVRLLHFEVVGQTVGDI